MYEPNFDKIKPELNKSYIKVKQYCVNIEFGWVTIIMAQLKEKLALH